MTSENKLHYLIDLVDDGNEEVRSEIIKQLNGYGFALERDLKNLSANVINELIVLTKEKLSMRVI